MPDGIIQTIYFLVPLPLLVVQADIQHVQLQHHPFQLFTCLMSRTFLQLSNPVTFQSSMNQSASSGMCIITNGAGPGNLLLILNFGTEN
jgi:hypothetical protein